jgi:hypothetical protein
MKASRILLTLLAVFLLAVSASNNNARSSRVLAGQPGLPVLAAALPQTPSAPPATSGIIDGSVNPELIPDDVAYRLILTNIAEPQNATDAQKARFRAKIASAGLSADDAQALFQIVAKLQGELAALDTQASQIEARDGIVLAGTPDYQTLCALAQQRLPVFQEAMSALPAHLSADGVTNFQAYVQKEKHGMKYLPDSSQTP